MSSTAPLGIESDVAVTAENALVLCHALRRRNETLRRQLEERESVANELRTQLLHVVERADDVEAHNKTLKRVGVGERWAFASILLVWGGGWH